MTIQILTIIYSFLGYNMSTFGIDIENNQGIALLDDFSRQVQIRKTVTGIVPGQQKHWNYWHHNTNVMPRMYSHSPAQAVVLPYAEKGPYTQAVFAKIKQTGNGHSSSSDNIKSFQVNKAQCVTQIDSYSDVTGLSTNQMWVDYDGPVEGSTSTDVVTGTNVSGTGPAIYGDISRRTAQTATRTRHLAGFDLGTCTGNFLPYPDSNMFPIHWGANTAVTSNIIGFTDWGSYIGFVDFMEYYNLAVYEGSGGHSPEDVVGYRLAVNAFTRRDFGYSAAFATTHSTPTNTITVAPKMTNVTAGWFMTTAGDTIVPNYKVTAVSHAGNTSTITFLGSTLTGNAGSVVNFVPPMRITNIESANDVNAPNKYKITFDSLTHVNNRANVSYFVPQDCLMFTRAAKYPWETWAKSGNSSDNQSYFGWMPRVVGAHSNTNQITVTDGRYFETGMKIYVSSHNLTNNTAKVLGGRISTYQGNRTVTGISMTGTANQAVITVSGGNMTLSSGNYFMGVKDHGFTLEVLIGDWSEDTEESSGYGVEVFNSNSELTFSSDRKNFVIENISSSNSCIPKITTTSGQGVGKTPGRIDPDIASLTYEPTDSSNYDDYYVLLTSLGPVARFAEGNGETQSYWGHPATTNSIGANHPNSRIVANNGDVFQNWTTHQDTPTYTVPSSGNPNNHSCIYNMAWTFSFPGATQYREQLLYDNGMALNNKNANNGSVKTNSNKLGIGLCAQPSRLYEGAIDSWPGWPNEISGYPKNYRIGQDHFASTTNQYLIVGKIV